MYLIDNPNTYKDVAQYHILGGATGGTSGTNINLAPGSINSNFINESVNKVFMGSRVIAIKNLTTDAGATTLTYMLKKQLDANYSVLAVEVDKNDPAFENPTKPIGRFLTKEEAEENEANGVRCMEDAGRGYRVVVASPMPQRIRELETIKTLVNAGHIVITCGGGGIPVISENGKLVGVNAVIDKDNASSLLAAQLGADYLVILTAVEKVAINFGKENQEWLSDLTVEQAKEYIAEEQFAKGSMLPKIEAAIRFAESGEGRRTLITLLDKAAEGIAGKTGTVIHQ